jgi:glutamine synthetase adenylyltransferase
MTCWEQQLRPGDWTLSELMHCCDHPYDDVQRFARQLLTERFRAEEAAQWLADLSQHPSESMQLFVSQWLEQVFQLTPEQEKAALLNKLLPYFLSVLSRVNRSRVTRLRSQHLLHGLAKQQADLAHLVIPLYVRLVATQAVQDKASYILGLTEILQIHPQLATLAEGIVSMPPAEIRSHRRGEKV